jgi:3-hydroxyisobutyrate dehydrogenase
VVLVAVRDQAQLESALLGPGGAAESIRAGGVVVVTSTIGPEAVREVADRLATQDIRTVDAPVSGGPVRAGGGTYSLWSGQSPKHSTLPDPCLIGWHRP